MNYLLDFPQLGGIIHSIEKKYLLKVLPFHHGMVKLKINKIFY